MNIGVIGAGKMGCALARLWATAGHDVILSGNTLDSTLREKADACGATAGTPGEAAHADVVMLSVWPADIVSALEAAGDLRGRVLITCVSALHPDFTGATIGMPTDLTRSIAETIAEMRPAARVVEAFNTTFAEVLSAPSREIGGSRPSVLYCGDDANAKAVARELIAGCGFDPFDGGPLRNARSIETLSAIWVQTAVAIGTFPIAGLRILT